jgi:hypothetical protein
LFAKLLSKRDVIYVVAANDASRTEKESAVEKLRGRTPFPIEVGITRYAGGSVLVSMAVDLWCHDSGDGAAMGERTGRLQRMAQG